MNQDNYKNVNQQPEEAPKEEPQDMINEETPEDVSVLDAEPDGAADETTDLEKEVLKLNESLEKEKKEYLFLMADFDNYRKRTLKEKSELLKTAAEKALKGLLPIIDDFERGIKAASNTDNSESVKEGMELIYNKLVKYLEENGVKAMDTAPGTDFDAERHDAISAVPVPDESQKGKILDTIEKGYTINDKVMRHAKVVVGQ